MIQSNKFGAIKKADLVAYLTFVQNICLGQKRCTPKCPLKDPYYKCKLISDPGWLKWLDSHMYSKIAAIYPLFNRLRTKCLFGDCKKCGIVNIEYDNLYYEGRRYIKSLECGYYKAVVFIRNVINNNTSNWRYLR